MSTAERKYPPTRMADSLGRGLWRLPAARAKHRKSACHVGLLGYFQQTVFASTGVVMVVLHLVIDF